MANEYRFEVYVSNSKRNDLQNVTGKYGTGTGDSFVGVACPAGTLCVENGRLPLRGYESAGLKNANSWYMNAATSGKVDGLPGDHTGIYACNTYDVNKATAGDLVINFAGKTLGLTVPADERADFTELLVGESYNWGADNFSTLPTDITATPYATIANGLWVAAAAAPTDGSIYAEIVDISKRFTEGAYDAGAKYTLRILRSAVSA